MPKQPIMKQNLGPPTCFAVGGVESVHHERGNVSCAQLLAMARHKHSSNSDLTAENIEIFRIFFELLGSLGRNLEPKLCAQSYSQGIKLEICGTSLNKPSLLATGTSCPEKFSFRARGESPSKHLAELLAGKRRSWLRRGEHQKLNRGWD